jgi:transcriptional regulator with XRE-family HTH domain
MLAEVIGHRLAEVRRARGLTQQQVADRVGVTKGRISQIEGGEISGHDVLARYAAALGGRFHQAIYFDDVTSPPSRSELTLNTSGQLSARRVVSAQVPLGHIDKPVTRSSRSVTLP